MQKEINLKGYVYRLLNKNEEIIYIGSCGDLYKRLKQHFEHGHLGDYCYNQVLYVDYAEFRSRTEAYMYEQYEITKYQPEFNDNGKIDEDVDLEYFSITKNPEWNRIYAESNKPFNVFTFFVNLVGTINNKTKEWHMSQDEMTAQWSCSKRTVNDYLEQLENMQLIYIYRHKKRRANGTYHKLNNSYGRYRDKDAVIAEAQKYADTVECEDLVEKLDRRAIKLRYNAYCNGAKKYIDNSAAVIALYRECIKYNKSLKSKPVEGCYNGEWKQGELLDLSVFPDEVRNQADDNWGEVIDFSIEEMLDMPVMGEDNEQNNICNNESHGENDREHFCFAENDLY
jgi:GIY-YIG catalytic domain protein